ncbi:MAG: aminopeptidase P family protein [Verrucomicrobia bacterium]|nr:aminopeptidase P family protein [Verrucomicrobiota bacterium]
MSRKNETLLMVADTERDANMLYAVGVFVPDPFIYLRADGRKPCLVLNDLEVDRARQEAPQARVLSWDRFADRLRRDGVKRVGFPQVVRALLREQGVKRVVVPANFPHGLARQLRDLRVKVRVRQGAFFPERAVKRADEVKKISAAVMMAEVGLAEAIQVLKNSKIGKDRRLMHHNVPLTSEKLQAVINIAIIQTGGLANHTIVAGGRQACNPHERGRGPLKAHEPIVIDIFPRSQRTGYFGDLTRTVVRGRASEAVRKLHHLVARGQEIAFQNIRPGASGAQVHKLVQDFFREQGCKTARKQKRMQGFFHGTGHGLGLDLHEGPRLSPNSEDKLTAGNVVTVEPGLYYSDVGGVRLEDVVLVTRNGCRNLTEFDKQLEV